MIGQFADSLHPSMEAYKKSECSPCARVGEWLLMLGCLNSMVDTDDGCFVRPPSPPPNGAGQAGIESQADSPRPVLHSVFNMFVFFADWAGVALGARTGELMGGCFWRFAASS